MIEQRLKPCPWCKSEVSITYNSMEKAFAVWHKDVMCALREPIWIETDNIKCLADAYKFWNNESEGNDK